MQQQNYVPLGNFLKHQIEHCSDPAANESLAAQFAYLSQLHNNQLPIAELQRRIEHLENVKARFNLTTVDNRRQYRAKVYSKIAEVSNQLGVAA